MRAPSGAALLVAAMLNEQPSWLVRRKLALEFVDTYWHRRRLTIDYVAPTWVKQMVTTCASLHGVPVPVSFLDKAPAETTAYDLTDRNGNAIGLPVLEQRLEFGVEVLAALTQMAVKPHYIRGVVPRVACVREAVRDAKPNAKLRADAIADLRRLERSETLWRSGHARVAYLRHAKRLIDRSLLVIERDVPAEQEILKLSFLASHHRAGRTPDEPKRAGLKPYEFSLELAAWEPQASHVELEAPPGKYSRPNFKALMTHQRRLPLCTTCGRLRQRAELR